MIRLKFISLIAFILHVTPSNAQQLKPVSTETDANILQSGRYSIMQSWIQEKEFQRPYYVEVPHSDTNESSKKKSKFPVFIFLHGNGGKAKSSMQGFMRHHKKMAMKYIMVFAQGYRDSWNIVSERSKADDRGFVESIVETLATFENVAADNFSIMGNSNGAALVNQMAIESKLPQVRNYITGVSQLNVWQYDGNNFKAKGKKNQYQIKASPMKGKRLMNISGTEDKLVPYYGGPSKIIPANDGKLAFVDAEVSTFCWARQMGYNGAKLIQANSKIGNLEIYSYLNGDVVHCKMNKEGHGTSHKISEDLLLYFLQGGDVGKDQNWHTPPVE